METNEIAKKKWWKGRWTLRKEVKARVSQLENMGAKDEAYKPTLDGIKQAVDIRNSKIEAWTKIGQAVGTLALGIFVAYKAYDIDNSDDIPRNKQSMNLFGRIFRF